MDENKLRRVPQWWTQKERNKREQFYVLQQQLQRERELALTTVDRILRDTPRQLVSSLVERTELRTCGALERLAEIVDVELPRDPKYAEALASLAVSLAEDLTNYPEITIAQSRAHAWKDFAKTLTFLGRHQEALEAFAQAEAQIDHFDALQHDVSIIRLNLAIAYQEIGRFEEAQALLAECKQIFRGYGDTRLYIISAFYEGLLLQRMHRYREARETHLLLIASTSPIDEETQAALHRAIGYASLDLGDYEPAEDNLQKAAALYMDLGQPIEAVKCELGRGRLLIRRGAYERGINHLRPVRHQFLKNSLAEEAGICGLDMVEAMLSLRRSSDAESLARTVLNEFLAASLSARAITALGYLAEAIAAKRATPKTATHVREYVLSLRTQPEREFKEP